MKKSRRRVLNCCGTLAVIRTARPASFWWARAGYASSMRVVWNWRVSGRAENAPGSPTFWLAMLRFFALSSVHLRQRAELPVSSGEDDGGFYGRGGNSEEKGGGESMVSFHRASSLSLFLLSQTYALFICLVGASLIVNMFVCQKRQQRYKLVVDAVSAMGSMTPSLNLEHLDLVGWSMQKRYCSAYQSVPSQVQLAHSGAKRSSPLLSSLRETKQLPAIRHSILLLLGSSASPEGLGVDFFFSLSLSLPFRVSSSFVIDLRGRVRRCVGMCYM